MYCIAVGRWLVVTVYFVHPLPIPVLYNRRDCTNSKVKKPLLYNKMVYFCYTKSKCSDLFIHEKQGYLGVLQNFVDNEGVLIEEYGEYELESTVYYMIVHLVEVWLFGRAENFYRE